MSPAALLALARAKGARIATAESCTGGMISAALTDVAGSSDVFDRGFVTYSNAAKQAMLGVSPDTLARVGAVSEEVAREMAEGALARSDATLAVAVTGIAGPGGSEFKPEGRVCFGLAVKGRPTLVETVEFGPRGRAAVRSATVAHALSLLAQALGDLPARG
ncbi:nicotinamide-nucleotide amidohydrolase family protein [Rhodobacter sphaeroides]|uniref:Competence-damaged inducible protein n=1 Tax=Cereibacter sphaeroides (strain ATCC 17023 / DSM 158 / JCM 6121 / CCUG 31486 / LMG 2827 / NBRC 12203 / NCIMB 8253 / ATH 2.4.1.) TaxID=272943 RepID=Q3J2K6_CERS4|nr:nicotinamide-nucleotide amidohydrolase family protein [Cereibacter sphaeroides]ABA78978.1 Putative competence-damaged inducible protein [Cereibacter sphaeroides 2.4.1]AMJ47301.1 damage-inducible protein CinA [Cereibacter sphaeroides]ANS34014.1 damage-inducible protein CinA [Cereibacter sphaeroides]ATN63058.1 damage-inducible protein CinA [Cereibacter sphaeroides]AXC61186.1 nicotinamide-nucleotide amidohydrolase family protein [Cereibacter sphaeroides 2.4.1]